jgi:hypothetical protein
MSVIIQGAQLRTIAFGQQVTKAAANLPQTATATLFTVAGGNILVTSLLGVVSGTAIQNQACTLALGTVPTTGTASTTGIATAVSIINKEIGTWVAPQASSGASGALVVGGNAGASLFLPVPFTVPAGTISWTTSASNTGKMAWYLTYVPLDTGASVS